MVSINQHDLTRVKGRGGAKTSHRGGLLCCAECHAFHLYTSVVFYNFIINKQ